MKNIKHKRNIKVTIKNTQYDPPVEKYEEKGKKRLTATVILITVFILSIIIAFFTINYSTKSSEMNETNESSVEKRNVTKPHDEVYLFIFNFHWNNYVSYTFIIDVYVPYLQKTFKKKCEFVLYGPVDSNTYPIRRNGLTEGGYYSYYTVVKAYHDLNDKLYYDGYFLLNDDGFFDPIVFYKNGFNFSYPIIEGLGTYPANFTEWLWPAAINDKGISYRQAYLNVRNILCNSSDSSKFKKLCQFDINQNFHGYADFFYIPKSLIQDFVYLYDLAYKEGMFLEMAVNAFTFNYEYRQFGNKCYFIQQLGECPHVHPIKYSYSENRQITRDYINRSLFHLNHNSK